jgi:hypothetical protein
MWTSTVNISRDTEVLIFGMSQFPLYTMMIFDKWQNGCPGAYVVTSRSKQLDLGPWMLALKTKMTATLPEWRPNAFIVDDAQAEINALRYDFLSSSFAVSV